MGEPDQPSAAGEPTLPRLSADRLRFLAMNAHGRGSAIANSDAGAVCWECPTRGQVHAVAKEAEERSLATECLESREKIAELEGALQRIVDAAGRKGAHAEELEAKLAALEGEARVAEALPTQAWDSVREALRSINGVQAALYELNHASVGELLRPALVHLRAAMKQQEAPRG